MSARNDESAAGNDQASAAGASAPVLCSAWSSVDEPLLGTAAHATAWLCVEHPGPWGRDIVSSDSLGPGLTSEIARRCDAAGVRLQLIRVPRTARSAADRVAGVREAPPRFAQPGTITAYLARSVPGQTWIRRFVLTDWSELLELDLSVASETIAPQVGEPCAEPIVLVCAHSKRDQCCAIFGRAVAVRLAQEYPGQVWEASHTGGHRFAPSMIVLPTGYTYGRLDAAVSAQAVAAAAVGEVLLDGLRGRSCYRPVAQAAEIAVREHERLTDVYEVQVDETGPEPLVTGRHGRQWSVEFELVRLPPRPASCGAAAKPVTARKVVAVHAKNYFGKAVTDRAPGPKS